MGLLKKMRFWAEDFQVHPCKELGPWRRCYHVHLRKTGGTSINQMFLGLDGGDGAARYQQLARAERNRLEIGPRVFVGWNRKLIEKGAYFYAFSHLPFHLLRLPPGTLLLTCFRDPVARLFSHYRMLREYERDRVPHPCMEVEGPWLGKDFGDFLRRVPRDHALCQLYMYSPSYALDEALDNAAKIHHIFFTESLTEGISRFNAVTGLHLRSLHSKKTQYQEPLHPREEAQARELLEPEITFYQKIQKLHSSDKTVPSFSS